METIVDLCPYWTYPPTGGGPLRVHNMNRVVAKCQRVVQFSARPTLGHRQGGWGGLLKSRTRKVANRYWECQYSHPVVLGTSYLAYRMGLHSDIFMSSVLRLLAPRQLHQIVDQASIIQVEHPWLYDLASSLAGARPIVYIAHNVEAKLWKSAATEHWSLLSGLANRPRELEERAVRCASATVAMSVADADILINQYGADAARIHIIPNGVDLETRRPATREEKAAARLRLKLDNRPVLLFTGSDHYPNREALEHILRWQARLGPELGVQFVVVGSVGSGTSSTEHLRVEGFVDSVLDYLMAADVALNPLTSGSGTSLKVVEYLACGLPTVTTATGIRGLEFEAGNDVLLGDVHEFPQLMAQIIPDCELQAQLARNGRKAAEQRYGWESLGERMLNVYREVVECKSA